MVTQVLAVGATVSIAAVATFVILKVVDLLLGLRVKPEDEDMGLDLSLHGEAAYQPDPQNGPVRSPAVTHQDRPPGIRRPIGSLR